MLDTDWHRFTQDYAIRLNRLDSVDCILANGQWILLLDLVVALRLEPLSGVVTLAKAKGIQKRYVVLTYCGAGHRLCTDPKRNTHCAHTAPFGQKRALLGWEPIQKASAVSCVCLVSQLLQFYYL